MVICRDLPQTFTISQRRLRRFVVVTLTGQSPAVRKLQIRPSILREDQLTMETKLEQIAVKAVNQLPKSVGGEIRTPRSVGAGGGRPPPAPRGAGSNDRPYLASFRVFRILTRMYGPAVRCKRFVDLVVS